MEVSRLRLLFLIAAASAALPGCALIGREDGTAPERLPPASNDTATVDTTVDTAAERPIADASTDRPAIEPSADRPIVDPPEERPIIDPQVERREIRRTRIDTEDFELGVYGGLLSIEDFESNVVYGARLAYHLSEDFFLEATLGQSRAGRTSYENLSGSADLLTDDERDYTYYALSMGWNALPGEIFIGRNRAYNTSFYLVTGIGSTHFGGDDLFTVNAGFGYRILPADWIAVHFDVRDHIYDTDLLGEKKIVNNLEAHLGLSIFF